jgi:hypothetical protein
MIQCNALKLLAIGVVGLSLVGCRTSSGTSSTESIPPGAQGMPVMLVLDISGDLAEGVYKSLPVTETGSSKNAMKQKTGRLYAYCHIESSAAESTCSVRVPLPPGAMGFPAPPFLTIKGEDAVAFAKEFKVPVKKQAGGYTEQVFETQNGVFRCDKTAVSRMMPPGAQGMPALNPFEFRCYIR